MSAASKFFYIRTTNKSKTYKVVNTGSFAYNKKFKISIMKSIKFYIFKKVKPIKDNMCCCCQKDQKKKVTTQNDNFLRIYNHTQNQLTREMNLIKIIRSIRDMKILMNNSLMSVGMKHHIRNSKKNIINLEEGI